MESTTVYWGYVGIMENKMKTTICETRPDGLLYRIMKTVLQQLINKAL